MPSVWISNGIPHRPGLNNRHGSRCGAGNHLGGLLYGPKAKAALIAHPEATVEVEHARFQCGACGKLESRLAVTLKTPDQVRILQRCDCGKAMHRIRAEKDMVCPECKRPLEVTDLVAVTMWD